MQVECSNPEARDSTIAWVGAYLINYAFVLAGAHAALIRIIQVFNLVAHALCGRSRWSGQVPVRSSALTRWLSITANSPWHFTVLAVSKLFTSLLMLNRESCSRNSVLINSVFFLLAVAVTLLGDRSPSSVHFYAHAKTVC